jgi:acetyl-CoA carboxylase beta subunit
MSIKRQLFECQECHEHFYADVVQDGLAVCPHRKRECPVMARAALEGKE